MPVSYLYKKGDTAPTIRYTDVKLGYYLGVPVVLISEPNDEWVLVIWPDDEKPGKKPFTYKDQRKWRIPRSQNNDSLSIVNLFTKLTRRRNKMSVAEPTVAQLNDLSPIKPGQNKEPQFAIDTSGSMSYPAADGSKITRWDVVREALGSLVSALETQDSMAAKEKEAGEDKGGVMTVTFASDVTDLEDLSSENLNTKLTSIQIGGGTNVQPAIDKLTELYMEEFGDTPDMDKPLQLLMVITDGEAADIDKFIAYLNNLSSRTFVVVAIVGYGTDHDKALAQYQAITSPHLRVLTFNSTTNPQDLSAALLALI